MEQLGKTALHWAAKSTRPRTVLKLAALCNAHRGVVSSLLAVGGQELLSIKSSAGHTARELAATVCHTDVVAEIDRWVAQNYPPAALR